MGTMTELGGGNKEGKGRDDDSVSKEHSGVDIDCHHKGQTPQASDIEMSNE